MFGCPSEYRQFRAGFTLLELLVSTAIMGLVLITVMSLMNMTSSLYSRTMGQLDSFETARTAFDALGRTLRQATLLSYLGYNDPHRPTAYQLRSDLHFFSGPQTDLGLADTGLWESHGIFFQAASGQSTESALRRANQLLASTGFYLAYGDDPLRPTVLNGKVAHRYRYRLFQWIEPREAMSVYEYTITRDGAIPVAQESYHGSDWFAQAPQRHSHPIAENVIALVFLPVYDGAPRSEYLWNSRDGSDTQAHHRLPQGVHVILAAIDEKSALRLGNPETAPELLPPGLFVEVADFEADLQTLETALSGHPAGLNFRIFKAFIPMGATHTDL